MPMQSRVPERWLAPIRRVTAMWSRLCEPLAVVEDSEDRRKSRLMASISLALGLTLVPVFIFWLVNYPSSENDMLVSLVILFLLLVIQYFLSHLGSYKISCVLSIAVGTAVVIYFAGHTSNPDNQLNLIDYLAVILLYASLFLSMPMLLIVFAAEVLVILSLTWLLPGVALPDVVSGPLEFNIVTGTMIVLVTQHRNLLERHRRDALAESERQRTQAEEFSSTIVTKTTLDGRWLTAPPGLRTLTGYGEAELLNMTYWDITHPSDYNIDLELAQQLVWGKRKSFDLEKRYIRKDGQVIWIYLNCSVVVDANGAPLYFLTYLRDITQQKETEETYRLLIDNSLQGFTIIQDNRIVFANTAVANFLGHSHEELLSFTYAHILEMVHPEDQELVRQRFQDLLSGNPVPVRSEFRLIHRSGRWVWIEAFSTWIEYRGRAAIQTSFMDIAERKRAEEALRQSEAKSRALVAAMPDILFLQNHKGVFLDVYARDQSLLLASPDQIIGRDMREILDPNLAEEFTKIHEKAIRTGEICTYEYPLEIRGAAHYFEARILSYDDDKILSFVREITDRKRTEDTLAEIMNELEARVMQRTLDLMKANDRLTELDRLKSKFIDDISHELRTPLATLNLRLYLLQRDDSGRREEHIAVIRNELNRINEMMKNILDFSELSRNSKQDKPAPVDLNALVSEAVTTHSVRIDGTRHSLKFEPGIDVPLIKGKASFLMRVIVNLISNAIKYTPQGSINIRTFYDPPRKQVCVEILDTGMGIAPEDLAHLFERFYRGQRVGSYNIPGSGLGLAIVKEIIDEHQGTIEVESEVDKGSTFRVWLPVS